MNAEIITKFPVRTDSKYGCPPEKRKIEEYIRNGIINLDKPSGPTSHEVSAWVRDIFRAFGVSKAGHSGTLDPGVTGVLPIALQNSVKIIPALIRAPKQYIAIMHLHEDISGEKIRNKMNEFIGRIEQMPPKLSGVKKQLRKRNIYSIEILEIEKKDVLFSVECEAGTYIRTLCIDFGKSLGINAHMQELRRTKAGTFSEETSVNLHALKDAVEFYLESKDETLLRKCILPIERGIAHLGKIFLKDSAVSAVCNGAPLHAGGIAALTSEIKAGDMIALMSLKGELAALGTAKMSSEDIAKKDKGIAAAINRVVMPAGIYPREW